MMRIPALSHVAQPVLPNEQVPVNTDTGWLGQVPPAVPAAPRPSRAEPSWPAPALPGEDDGSVWDPLDPPLYG
jgi:hypothetical protein